MQRLKYAGGDYLVDNRMADAVLHYARVLAERRRVEIVELKVGQADGDIGWARLLIGVGFPIAVAPASTSDPQFDGQLAEPGHELHVRRLTDGLTKAPDYRLPPAGSPVSYIDDDF